MTEGELRRGELVAPFAGIAGLRTAYYLVYLPGALERQSIRAFRSFLRDQAGLAEPR